MGVERGELGVGEAGDVLDVVGLVGLEEEQRVGPVVGERLLGEEVRVARRHDALDGEEPGVAVVGVQPVALPRVVAEHDGGPQLPDPVRHLPPLAHAGLELAVDPAEEHALRRWRRAPAAAARCSAWRVTTSAAASVRRVPAALGAVGADEVVDDGAGRRPLGERGAAAELDVVGVGADGERDGRGRQVQGHADAGRPR